MRSHFTFLCFRPKFGLKPSLKLGLSGKIKSLCVIHHHETSKGRGVDAVHHLR